MKTNIYKKCLLVIVAGGACALYFLCTGASYHGRRGIRSVLYLFRAKTSYRGRSGMRNCTYFVQWPVIAAGQACAVEEVLSREESLPVSLRVHVVEVAIVVVYLQ
jgi:hypothetical protein